MKQFLLLISLLLAIVSKSETSEDIAYKLISEFETFSPTYYNDNGVLRIGYGFSKLICDKTTITKEEANNILSNEINNISQYLTDNFKELNKNQKAATISFIYNVGLTKFSKSTFRKLLKNKEYDKCSFQIKRWIYSNHKISNGLIRRRNKESKLFDTKESD